MNLRNYRYCRRCHCKAVPHPGIAFLVPFMAVLFSLVQENTNRKLQSREVRECEI